MKKHLGIFMALVLVFCCLFGTTAFAAEPATVSDADTATITTRGTLSGYGYVWHNYGSSTSGNFYVNVSGSGWPTAQVTFNIESFGSNDAVAVQLYRPDGTFAWSSLDNPGDYINMSNKDNWHNIKFTGGQTGTYRIHYSIINWNGSTPSSGRINCWIY